MKINAKNANQAIISGNRISGSTAGIRIDLDIPEPPPEYPFISMPGYHIRCLVCDTEFPATDLSGITGNSISLPPDDPACSHCRARIPRSMWQRIWNFLREGT